MSALALGDIIQQRYRVIRTLGAGGFGETYEVEFLNIPGMDKPRRALKRLHSQYQSSADLIRRFEKEASILYRLGEKYDFIPTLYEYFEDAGSLYIVQELIVGKTIASELESGQTWTEAQVLEFLLEMAEILGAIYGEKVIHRDIKPHNIMRRENGKLAIIDFGIIKEITTDRVSQISRSMNLGTPFFTPVEQFRGQPRYSSDIYALGITAILVMTAKYPDELDDRDGEIYWRDCCQVDDRLADIIDKMVRALPIDRYSDTTALLANLQSLSHGSKLSPKSLCGKHGYIDESGVFVITPQFDFACYFAEGLARVKVNGKWGYIDRTGNYITPPQFDDTDNFSEGLAQVKVNGKWGYIDRTGNYITPPQFDGTGNFIEGLARVKVNGKWGYIDNSGNYIILPQFDDTDNFSEGLARVKVDDKYRYIDRTGNYISPLQFDDFCPCNLYCSDELSLAKISDKWGYVDNSGNYIIHPQFDDIYHLYDDLARVKINEKYGYVNRSNGYVIPTQFDTAELFQDGLALVKINDKYAYVDRTGNYIILPQFDDAKSFHKGLAQVKVNGKWGYIDRTGKIVKWL